jgi:hypothetical protein
MAKPKVDYICAEDGRSYLEIDMARIAKPASARWLAERIQDLTEDELMQRFNSSKKQGTLGPWGTIQIGPYIVLCQRAIPEEFERNLGEPITLLVAGVGRPDEVLAAVRAMG